MHMKAFLLPLMSGLLLGCLSACQSVLPHKLGGTPDQLRPHASKAETLWVMGPPLRKLDWKDAQGIKAGSIWQYQDRWWNHAGWANRFADWTLYFDHKHKLSRWSMDSPRSMQEDTFRHFPD
jgi:hypothetical protein